MDKHFHHNHHHFEEVPPPLRGTTPIHVPTDGHNHPLYHHHDNHVYQDNHHHHHEHHHDIIKRLFIRHDQIMADIDTQAQIISIARQDEKGAPNKLFMTATDAFGVQFDRWIDKYLDASKARMAAYVITEERKAAMNAKRKWDEVTILLGFPPSWNDTTFEQLCSAVHDYIVNSCLMEFCLLALSSKDPLTSDEKLLADNAYADIKHFCVTSKPYTQKKTLNPF